MRNSRRRRENPPHIGLLRDRGRLPDDQPRRTALRVISLHQVIRRPPHPRPRQRSHYHAIAQRDAAEVEGEKQRGDEAVQVGGVLVVKTGSIQSR